MKTYTMAVEAYGEALSRLESANPPDPKAERQVAHQRSVACQIAIRAFFDHIQAHGCEEAEVLQAQLLKRVCPAVGPIGFRRFG